MYISKKCCWKPVSTCYLLGWEKLVGNFGPSWISVSRVWADHWTDHWTTAFHGTCPEKFCCISVRMCFLDNVEHYNWELNIRFESYNVWLIGVSTGAISALVQMGSHSGVVIKGPLNRLQPFLHPANKLANWYSISWGSYFLNITPLRRFFISINNFRACFLCLTKPPRTSTVMKACPRATLHTTELVDWSFALRNGW